MQPGNSGGSLLPALRCVKLPVGAGAHVTDDALGTDEQPPTHAQPATQTAWLRAKAEQRYEATNLMRGVTNVRTGDCRRGCDVVGACHTLFADGTHLAQHRPAAPRCTWLRRAKNRE